jgi:hypothetical protein
LTGPPWPHDLRRRYDVVPLRDPGSVLLVPVALGAVEVEAMSLPLVVVTRLLDAVASGRDP